MLVLEAAEDLDLGRVQARLRGVEGAPHRRLALARPDLPGHVAQERALAVVVRRLEPADQLVERVEHLLAELLGDLVLELAAVGEERGEALRPGQREEPALVQQEAQRRADRAPRRLQHVGDPEVEPARVLAARRGDEAQHVAVHEEPRGHAALAEHPLHPTVR